MWSPQTSERSGLLMLDVVIDVGGFGTVCPEGCEEFECDEDYFLLYFSSFSMDVNRKQLFMKTCVFLMYVYTDKESSYGCVGGSLHLAYINKLGISLQTRHSK